MLCPPDDAEDSTGRSAAPFLLECGRQAGGVKHRDGPAISGEFKPGGSEAQKLTAIAFAPGILRTLTGSYGSAAPCLCIGMELLSAVCADGIGDLDSLMWGNPSHSLIARVSAGLRRKRASIRRS